jgi:ABC-type uncharacterized transport system YnjBCD substrate-binding protein
VDYELDDILSDREEINNKLQVILDELTEPWGVKVTNVELKAIDLPENMQRAMAKQAEAEREKSVLKLFLRMENFKPLKNSADAAQVSGFTKGCHYSSLFKYDERNWLWK